MTVYAMKFTVEAELSVGGTMYQVQTANGVKAVPAEIFEALMVPVAAETVAELTERGVL